MNLRHRLAAIPAFGLAAALAVPALMVSPAIAADGQKEIAKVTDIQGAKTTEELISGEGTTVVDPTDFTSDSSTLKSEGGVRALAERPASFDLRNCDLDGDGKNENYVTVVKNQNPFGTCWAFGSTAAAETSLLTELEKGVPAGEENNELNISEKDLIWFIKNPQPEDSLQPGEGIHTGSEEPASKFASGFISTATSSYAMGNGPVDETLDPVLEYHNNAPTVEEQYDSYTASPERVEELGLKLDHFLQAKPTGDWSIPEDWRGVQNWELEETYYLPSPASFEPTDDLKVKTYKFNQAGVDAIKEQLLAGRGVGIGFCADTSQPGQENVPHYMNQETSAHYTYENPSEGSGKGGQANHAVCIVGYDDTYSKENFNPDHQPEGDGAFIVKNSWGANTLDERNFSYWGIDGSGYFYLSYYDKSIMMPEAFDFLTKNDKNSSSADQGFEVADLYQYAFLPNDPTGTNHDSVTSYANVYEIRRDSTIRDVATQTFSLGTDVRFDIYLMNEGATHPSDGELLWSHEETFPYGGYHRVELDKTLQVKAGDKVGVVCTSQLPNGDYEVVNNQNGSKLLHDMQYADSTQGYWSEAIVDPGESFIGSPSKLTTYDDGTTAYEDYAWADYSVVLDYDKAQAQSVLNNARVSELMAARDAAYKNLSGLAQDDPNYAAANEALTAAQKSLEDAVEPIITTNAARGLLNAQDNFPLNITTQPADTEMLRLYNPNTGEHLYISDTVEQAKLLTDGWQDEGTAWVAPVLSGTPVYRLSNPFTGEHLFTPDEAERDALVDQGWSDEDVKFYSASDSATPVHRLYNPYEDGVSAHLYTTDANEVETLVGLGYVDEGPCWYAVK